MTDERRMPQWPLLLLILAAAATAITGLLNLFGWLFPYLTAAMLPRDLVNWFRDRYTSGHGIASLLHWAFGLAALALVLALRKPLRTALARDPAVATLAKWATGLVTRRPGRPRFRDAFVLPVAELAWLLLFAGATAVLVLVPDPFIARVGLALHRVNAVFFGLFGVYAIVAFVLGRHAKRDGAIAVASRALVLVAVLFVVSAAPFADGATPPHAQHVRSVTQAPEAPARGDPIAVTVRTTNATDLGSASLVYCRVENYACAAPVTMKAASDDALTATIPWRADFFHGVTHAGYKVLLRFANGTAERSPTTAWPAAPPGLPDDPEAIPYYFYALPAEAATSALAPTLGFALAALAAVLLPRRGP